MTNFELKVIPDFLDSKHYCLLIDQINKSGWKLKNKDLKNQSENSFFTPRTSLTVDDDNKFVYEAVGAYVKLKVKKHFKDVNFLQRWLVNGQLFGQESNFHKDNYCTKSKSITCVIFLNDFWSSYWGGEFCIYNSDANIYEHVAYIPNTAIIFPSEYEHCGRSPNINTDQIRTSIAFIFDVS